MKVGTREGSSYWWAVHHEKATGRLRWSVGLMATGPTRVGKAEATRVALTQLKEKMLVLTPAGGAGRRLTLGAALDLYCQALARRGAESADGCVALANKLLARGTFADRGRWCLPAGKPLETLSPQDLEDLSSARTREGNGPQTIAHEIKLIRAAVRHAAALDYAVPVKLTSGAVRGAWRMPKVPQKTRYLSLDEWRRLWEALDPDRPVTAQGRSGSPVTYRLTGKNRAAAEEARVLCLALTLCGGRWSEVKSIRWDDVNLDEGWVRLWGNKTRTSRLAPLPPPLREALAAWQGAPGRVGALVFPGRSEGHPRGATCRAISRAMERCGLNEPALVERHGRATVHSLRHTFASWSVQAGMGLYPVQAALGHAGPKMTQRYAHLEAGGVTRQIGEALGAFVGTRQGPWVQMDPIEGSAPVLDGAPRHTGDRDATNAEE